jgi:hypothetical protein
MSFQKSATVCSDRDGVNAEREIEIAAFAAPAVRSYTFLVPQDAREHKE